MTRPGTPWRPVAAAVAAAFALSALLTMHAWLPMNEWALLLRPSPEALIVVAATGVVAFLAGRVPAVIWGLAGALTPLAVFGAGEAITRNAFRRPLDLVADTGYIPGLFDLLGHGTFVASPFFYVPVIAAVVAGVVLGLHALLALVSRPRGAAALAAPGLLVACAVAFGAGEPLASRVAAAVARAEQPPPPPVEPASGAAAAQSGLGFPRLGTRDVLFFTVESYGQTVFAKPEHARVLLPVMEQASRQLSEAGYHVYSRYLVSPVFGGRSWLPDVTFLSGVWIDNEEAYASLLEGGAVSIPRLFARAGYETLLVMPGTVHGPWEEGVRFHGYHDDVNGWQFGYKGPMFSFVPVPDQYAIDYIHRRWVAREPRAPLFVQYTLVSSHAPFSRIPAYIDDWDRIGDGSIYNEAPNLVFNNGWIRGEAYDEGYAASIRYDITVLTEYLTRFLHGNELVVVVGDHQPKYPVTVKDAPFTVPVHVISRDAKLLAPLARMGFTPGLVPAPDPAPPRMDRFYPMFLELAGGAQAH